MSNDRLLVKVDRFNFKVERLLVKVDRFNFKVERLLAKCLIDSTLVQICNPYMLKNSLKTICYPLSLYIKLCMDNL